MFDTARGETSARVGARRFRSSFANYFPNINRPATNIVATNFGRYE